jgi:hypothetical protein
MLLEFAAINADIIYICNAYDIQEAFKSFVNVCLEGDRSISKFEWYNYIFKKIIPRAERSLPFIF